MDGRRRILVRDQFGNWTTTVLVAVSPLLVVALILYITSTDSEAWWEKFDDVFRDGGLLLVTTTIMATAIGSTWASVHTSLIGRIAISVSITLTIIAACLWVFLRFVSVEESAATAASDVSVVAVERGEASGSSPEVEAVGGAATDDGLTQEDLEREIQERVTEVSLGLFILALMFGSSLVWLSTTEAAARAAEARLAAEPPIDLTDKRQEEDDERQEVNGDQALEG